MPAPPARRARALLAAGVAAALALSTGLVTAWAQGAGDPVPGPATYPVVSGGEWTRGPNLVDDAGRFQPRQEHAVVELNASCT